MAYYTRQAARSGAKAELVELPAKTPRVLKKKPSRALGGMSARPLIARKKKKAPAKVR
jgi:hypothetical protein